MPTTIDNMEDVIRTDAYGGNKEALFNEADQIGFFQKQEYKLGSEAGLKESSNVMVTVVMGTGTGSNQVRTNVLAARLRKGVRTVLRTRWL